MKEKALSFLGILNRGKATLIGASLLHAKKLSLVLLASDCSENTTKEIRAVASRFSCPVLEGASKEELGKALGYDDLSGVGVTLPKAAKALIAKWNEKE